MFDLALLDEVPDCTRHVFNRHIWVDAMLIEDIDHVGLEALQGGFSHGPDTFRFAVCTLTRDSVLEAELGCDDDLVTDGCQRLTNEFFVRIRTVRFGRVKERHGAVKGGADDLDRLILFGHRAEAEAQPHAAEAKG